MQGALKLSYAEIEIADAARLATLADPDARAQAKPRE
jgi:hypothetical protein